MNERVKTKVLILNKIEEYIDLTNKLTSPKPNFLI